MNKLYVVMYHYVRHLSKTRYPEIKGLDTDKFKQQLMFFKKNFDIVSMEDVLLAFDHKKRLPDSALLLTFDDGYIDHYSTVFPILDKYNVQGSFFIPGKTFVENKLLDVNKVHFILASVPIKELMKSTLSKLDYYRGKEYPILTNEKLIEDYYKGNRFDSAETVFVKRVLQMGIPEELRNIISSELFKEYVGIDEDLFARELYMDYEHILCMKKNGMHIGLHGYDHYWLGTIPEEAVDTDISKALDCMKEFIYTDAWTMNYPYGSYNQTVIDIIKSKGCKVAFSTKIDIFDIDAENANAQYTIPRLDTNDFPPVSESYLQYER